MQFFSFLQTKFLQVCCIQYETIFQMYVFLKTEIMLIPLLQAYATSNLPYFEISEDDHPLKIVGHARDHWWTLDFANAFVSLGVNSRAKLAPSPRTYARNGAPRRWLGDNIHFGLELRHFFKRSVTEDVVHNQCSINVLCVHDLAILMIKFEKNQSGGNHIHDPTFQYSGRECIFSNCISFIWTRVAITEKHVII
jgi:hypothetical protein